ncbi:MAG: hypothetical protein VX000_11440 [Myxococcota bacterium]|nr:hypothetical protein [Myxococcota bacterium]
MRRMLRILGLGTIPVWSSGCGGCGPDPFPPPTLAEVSQEIQFQSVDRVGAHAYLATIIRTELREGDVVAESQEVFEIRWQGWDDFEVRRSVDGDIASAVRVVEGRAWVLRNDVWQRRPDAEPFRQELRLTWSGWDQAMDGFDDRVDYGEPEDGVVEGRPARRYALSLKPLPAMGKARRKRREAEGGPTSLSGFVWVDQTTAVRLVADVQGETVRGEVTRRIQLKLARSAFGQDQGIAPPPPGEVRPVAGLGQRLPQRTP